MAKKLSKRKKAGGPFLAAAFFCENILQDNDGILSAVRIFDSFLIQLHADTPANIPSKEFPIRLDRHLLIMFKSGDAPGKHEISIKIIPPDGSHRDAQTNQLEFTKSPHGGGNLRCAVMLEVSAPGLYWADVRLDGKLVTRMPLNIVIKREPPAAGIQVKSTRTNRGP